MPVSKRRSSPVAFHRNPSQVNGFYVHSSPPKVLQVHSSTIRQWLRAGDVNQLERFILDGQGYKLIGEYSPDPKVQSLLKQIPAFLAKSKKLHDATAKGDLKQLKKLLTSVKAQQPPLKNIHLSKTQGGLGLLHKAVHYGYPNLVEFLVLNYPKTLEMKDNDGKTPLHYCGASKDAGKIWPILVNAGADPSVLDSKGKSPAYYMERSDEIQLPEEKILSGISDSSTNDKNGILIKPSNIRIWIHDKDIRKLQRVIWEGHGAKLKVETSKHSKIKRFLDGVPYVLNVIKDVHSSVVNDDFEEFIQKTSDPIPSEILGSKDSNGLTPLHKVRPEQAAGLGRKKIAENIIKRSLNAVFAVDQEGKTPLHYAAVAKDDNEMYNLLTGNYADETALDKNGKTALYYKSNPKEITTKVLEVVPEAPRTSVTLPQTFDWSLFHPDGAAPLGNSIPSRSSFMKIENESEEDTRPEEITEKEERAEDKISMTESENVTEPATEEPEESKGFDIWTNDEDKQEEEEYEEEEVKENEEEEHEEKKEEEREEKEESVREEQLKEPSEPSLPSQPPTPEEVRQKREREIAEERQRLLDEGLLRISSQDSEDTEVREIIESGNMEKLAEMVLNGEGEKLRGKVSSNPEVQSFLDNTPVYMGKITAVHAAARSGSLKDLQAALDRRKFAIAKESSDKLGTTPLHAAVICENASVVRYLGGRFPETLIAKDKFGRTPLHYAAVLQDGQIYDVLLELGADPDAKDNEGHVPPFYKSSGELTQDNLLQMMGLPSLEAKPLHNQVSSPVTDPSIHNIEPEISFDEGVPLSKRPGNEDEEDENDAGQSNFSLTDRDEYGQSVLHFAAARAHGRGGLFQLIHESGVNLGYRDELYRTARDIAQQANIPENVNEIDKYVISLAAKGETGKLVELFLEGYDHILDLEDDEDVDIVTIASNKNHDKTLAFLKAIPALEEKREKIHRAVRAGNDKIIERIISESKNGRFLIIGKNTSGRCSLHVSVLCQQKEVTEFLAQKFPETLWIGDNLERTPLHYAMGVKEVEALSKILIKCGAKRVVKDLKGRQPTYYFMNKTEILKLQEEEDALSQEV